MASVLCIAPTVELVSDTNALEALCRRLASDRFVTVDTEFIRDRTYWPRLCLVQVAGADEAAAIDTLAPGMDPAPLGALLADRAMLKVFHSARQDIEIFYHLFGAVPAPVFDTQVAAMVCGFGDQVGYDTLVSKLAGVDIGKGSRFTDWSLRPLTPTQISYALADVTYMRTVYEQLRRRLERNGRASWVDEEMAILTDPATYRLDPETAWRRLKPRSGRPRQLAMLRTLAAWREREAQRRDVPRGRILQDETLREIVASRPRTAEELARVRGLPRAVAEGAAGREILGALEVALALPEDQCPPALERSRPPPGTEPMVELLRVLLKLNCEAHGVASRLVANAEDLERIAADDDAAVPALHGWRRRVFGDDALAIKRGTVGLAIVGRKLCVVPLEPGANASATRRTSPA